MSHHSSRTTPDALLSLSPLLCGIVLLSAAISSADDSAQPTTEPPGDSLQAEEDLDILAGHSYHGEVFNEGPRQKAYLIGGTGDVHFPVTTNVPQAQAFFDQGVGQLHGFWYLEAERSFRQAARLDPDCAMAYWGAAMANLRNAKRSKGFIDEAFKRKEHASARERMYLDAAKAYITADKDKRDKRNDAYTKALENLILKYPDDLEAKAFLALHLYQSRSSSTSYFSVDALLQDIFDIAPMHPAHHFRIHLWDHREPKKALRSAALCGQSSPSIAHMWHMPGHIFSRLKRYDDAAWQQEASARVDHAHMMRDRVMPDQIGNFAHNNEWFIRNLIHVGRVHDAVDLAKNMTELPRHPSYNSFSKRGSAKYGRQRLFQVLRTYELWEDIIALSKTPYLEPTEVPEEQVKRLRHLGLAYFQVGDLANGQSQISELQRRLEETKTKQAQAVKKAEEDAKSENKDKKETSAAVAKARRQTASKIKTLQAALNALKGHRAVAAEHYQRGIELLKKAGDVEPAYLARIHSRAGEPAQALKSLRNLVKTKKNEVHPLAVLADTLWQLGRKKEAEEAFDQLRDISGSLDLDVPLFARLAPLAKHLGLAADWRVQRQLPDDIGQRPDLDSLGPFRWKPSPASKWALKDVSSQLRSSREFHGQPHILIFYLGFGCLHCAEQLQEFAPRAEEFASAGLSMIAISTDDQEGLQNSIENYDGDAIPIPLVANPQLDVFKSFRVFDDFEDQPLHGTFVIDANGLVLWQDISYEPFMDSSFLLKEATRLLAQNTPASKEDTTTQSEKTRAVAKAPKHTSDSLQLIEQRLASNRAILVDVREPSEWDEGHLEVATLIPLSRLKRDPPDETVTQLLNHQKLKTDKIIYCHCRSGGRVLVAAPLLRKLGYDVRPLKAGYADLVEAGFEKAE